MIDSGTREQGCWPFNLPSILDVEDGDPIQPLRVPATMLVFDPTLDHLVNGLDVFLICCRASPQLSPDYDSTQTLRKFLGEFSNAASVHEVGRRLQEVWRTHLENPERER